MPASHRNTAYKLAYKWRKLMYRRGLDPDRDGAVSLMQRCRMEGYSPLIVKLIGLWAKYHRRGYNRPPLAEIEKIEKEYKFH